MKKPLIAAAALIAFAVSTAALASDIYKWVDEDGNVHYGDKPIGTQSERMAIASSATDPARVNAATRATADARTAAAERREERIADEAARAEQRAEAEQRAQQCADARAAMQRFITARRVYQEDENGERVYLDDAERQAARDRVENQISEHCN